MLIQFTDAQIHWNANVIILMKLSSLAALEVVKMTTSSAASDENFIKIITFSFQWYTPLCQEKEIWWDAMVLDSIAWLNDPDMVWCSGLGMMANMSFRSHKHTTSHRISCSFVYMEANYSTPEFLWCFLLSQGEIVSLLKQIWQRDHLEFHNCCNAMNKLSLLGSVPPQLKILTHKRHPISRPNRRAMHGVSFVGNMKKTDCGITARSESLSHASETLELAQNTLCELVW